MTGIELSGANATFSYAGSRADLRVTGVAYTYGVVSEESHARQTRAFYPHRRSQGEFDITLQLKGYREFRQVMDWFRNYTAQVMSQAMGDQSQQLPMTVSIPVRGFLRQGILTTGISDNDHVGSMVFSPTISFISVIDPKDPLSSVYAAPSTFAGPQVDANASLAFYPSSTSKYHDSQLYDTTKAPAPVTSVVGTLNQGDENRKDIHGIK